jgi:hypothetical protein
VVKFKAIYKKVLNSVIPKKEHNVRNKKFSLYTLIIFFKSRKNNKGDVKSKTKSHLKKASSNGCILELTNLPKIKFPDQNKTQSANKI